MDDIVQAAFVIGVFVASIYIIYNTFSKINDDNQTD